MFDLSQLFIEGCASDHCSFFAIAAIHKLILIDEIALSHLDDFNRDYQRDRNHCVDEDEVSEKVEDPIDRWRIVPLHVDVCCIMVFCENS